MKKSVIKVKTKLILGAALFVAIFFMVKNTQAATSTVMGTAWWGNQYQYLSFNCSTDVIGDRLDNPYNLCGGPYSDILLCGTGDHVFHFYSAPCSSIVHGVYISDSGNFSGSAWNNTRGYVNFFSASTTPDESFRSLCPFSCLSSNNCSACYDENTQRVYGWAQIANDGTWIKLDTALDLVGSASTTGVQIKSWNDATSTKPYYDSSMVSHGDFIGDATAGSDSLSFNCKSEGGKNSGGTCALRSYKVYISNLQIGHLTAPSWGFSQACGSPGTGGLGATLSWENKSGTQAGYEVVVNKVNHFSTSTGDYVCWSGYRASSQYFRQYSDCSSLEYNKNYYWWARLYDASNTPTQWYQFGAVDGHNGLADTHTNTLAFDGSQNTFKTYLHAFPAPSFAWLPTPVLVATTTSFISSSNYYTSAAPSSSPLTCSAPTCHYQWSTSDSLATSTNWTSATTTIFFHYATGSTEVDLSVSDPDNYSCSTSTDFGVTYPLPIWREIKAQ